jgi:hypothetical protein
MTELLCPQCKGRKLVFNPLSLFLTVGLPIALIMELNVHPDDGAMTKRICPTCKGKGYICIGDR